MPGGCQLYLISPPKLDEAFGERLVQALDAGPVAAFQFRVKGLEAREAAALAEPLLRICREREVAFIVNDDAALAKAIDADGVHLGQGDGEIADARELLGPRAQIGRTCHASKHLAMEAGEDGADYVAFGAFYPSTTKPGDHRPDPDLLRWWNEYMVVPSVAIGGITPDNCAPLVTAGADFIAVSGAVWNDAKGAAAAVGRFAEKLARAPASAAVATLPKAD